MTTTPRFRPAALLALAVAALAAACARGDGAADSSRAAATSGDTAAAQITAAVRDARASITRIAVANADSATNWTIVTSESDPARPAGAGLDVGRVHLITMAALGHQWCDERPADWRLVFDYYTHAESRFGGRYRTTCGAVGDVMALAPATIAEEMAVVRDTLPHRESVALPAITSVEMAQRLSEAVAGLRPECAGRLCPGDTPPAKRD